VAADPDQNLRPGVLDQTTRTFDLGRFEESTNEIHLETRLSDGSTPLVLVASLVQDGGWSARDERLAPVGLCLANGPFLGIVVPARNHEIRLTYRPPGLRLGILISAFAAAAVVIAGALKL